MPVVSFVVRLISAEMCSSRGTARFRRRGRGAGVVGRTSSPGRMGFSAFRASSLSLSMHRSEPNSPSQPEIESEQGLPDLSSPIASPLSSISSPGTSHSTTTSITLEKLYHDIKDVDGRMRTIDDRIVKMSAVMKELHDMLKKHCKSSFSIKGSPFEAQLKSKLAKLFCHSLTRKPGDSEIQVILGKGWRDGV